MIITVKYHLKHCLTFARAPCNNSDLPSLISFSKVTPSGPKGLMKGDVMKFILANNLKPIEVAQPEKQAKPAAKPAAPAKAESPAKPQYQVG